MLTFIFWASLLGIGYAYAGYPLVLWGIAQRRSLAVARDEDYRPPVTLIVTVHNEEARIMRKLDNILALDYPRDRLEVIFASDASTDATDDIVIRHAPQGVRLVRSPERRGKEHAQKCAIKESSGEILVFSDVATMLEPDGLQKIVANFADGSVGCVSSVDRFVGRDGQPGGEGAYVRYEMWLRSLEARVNSVVGLSGSFFAARRAVCEQWRTDIPSDFNTVCNAVRLGYRGVSDPASVGIYSDLARRDGEFARKVRTVTRGINALAANRDLLLRGDVFAWELFSHKMMRWLVPWFLVLALLSNAILALHRGVYRLFLALQVVCYAVAAWGGLGAARHPLLRIPWYFVEVNAAIALAWRHYATGRRYVTWTPSAR